MTHNVQLCHRSGLDWLKMAHFGKFSTFPIFSHKKQIDSEWPIFPYSHLFQSFPTKTSHFFPNFQIFISRGGGYIGQFSKIFQLFKSFPTEVAQNDQQLPILPPKWLRLSQNGQFWSIFNFSHKKQLRLTWNGEVFLICNFSNLFLPKRLIFYPISKFLFRGWGVHRTLKLAKT